MSGSLPPPPPFRFGFVVAGGNREDHGGNSVDPPSTSTLRPSSSTPVDGRSHGGALIGGAFSTPLTTRPKSCRGRQINGGAGDDETKSKKPLTVVNVPSLLVRSCRRRGIHRVPTSTSSNPDGDGVVYVPLRPPDDGNGDGGEKDKVDEDKRGGVFKVAPLKRIVPRRRRRRHRPSQEENVAMRDVVDGDGSGGAGNDVDAAASEATAAETTLANGDTDLIPGEYEGGLKVWECSLDLCRHLAGEIERLRRPGEGDDDNDSDNDGNDCRHALRPGGSTLELGCGHGLPGCLVLREGMARADAAAADACATQRRQRRRRGDDGVEGSVRAEQGDRRKGEGEEEEKRAEENDACSSLLPVVLFSDYNEFVLRDVTVPNVMLNAEGEDRPDDNFDGGLVQATEEGTRLSGISDAVAMAAGDWMELSSRLLRGGSGGGGSSAKEGKGDGSSTPLHPRLPSDGRFDLILAAETTYTAQSARDTANLMCRHLRFDTGVGLVATKRYYFGVGGGSDAFREECDRLGVIDRNGDCDDCNEGGGENDESKTPSAAAVTTSSSPSCSRRRLHAETVHVYDNGTENIRELLRVRLRK